MPDVATPPPDGTPFRRIIRFGRSFGVGMLVGPAALVLSAGLVPESAVGTGLAGKLAFALLHLSLFAGLALGAILLARSVPPRSASILVGSALALSWCFFGLLSSFPVAPFGTELPATVAMAGAAGFLSVLALALLGRGILARPKATVIAILLFAAVLNLAYRIGRALPDAPRGPGAGAVRDRPDIGGVPFPGAPGPYRVATLTYGSGTDRQRPEYGRKAAIVTRTVDGSTFVPGPWSVARTGYWGFDPTGLPLDGRVWYPEGKGPFPLVLIVHGMRRMTRYSEGGFAYLGELLASRGYAVASVDENFLNPGGYRYGNFSASDIDIRGWLLLEHLAVWDSWNRDPGSRFHGMIDMGRITLIGHSRGGEAVAAAAAFNRMERYPLNGNVPFDFRFGIRNLIALAPSDIAQPRHERSTPARIEDVNYLLLEGTHDRQVPSVLGSRVFQRVRFTRTGERLIKFALYVGGANHSQFNSEWGIHDLPFPARLMTALGAQMEAGAQRDIAKTCISAFLEATVKGDHRYLPFLRDPRRMRDWLPETRYVSRFEDSEIVPIAGFDEDIDPSTATIPGGRIVGSGLTRWREEDVDPHFFQPLGSRANRVASIGWEAGGDRPPALKIALGGPDGGRVREKSIDLLYFSVAVPDSAVAPAIDIRVADRNGREATLPLRTIYPLRPAMRYTLTRLAFLERPSQVLVLQTIPVPLARFREADPRLDTRDLREIEFRFDPESGGRILLDDIGLGSG